MRVITCPEATIFETLNHASDCECDAVIAKEDVEHLLRVLNVVSELLSSPVADSPTRIRELDRFMRILNREKVSVGTTCPKCGSKELDHIDDDGDGPAAWVELFCNDCKCRFTAYYDFVEAEILED